jgi:hypothetical protein
MTRLRMTLRLQVFIRRHPTYFFLILGTAILVVYKGLNFFPWGHDIKQFIIAMSSAEIGGYQMYIEGVPLGYILLRLFLADTINVFIDLYFVNLILSVKAMQDLLKIVGKAWGQFKADVRWWSREYLSGAFRWVSSSKSAFLRGKRRTGQWFKQHHCDKLARLLHADNPMGGLQDRLNGIAANPQKARLRTVFWLCQLPKVIPIPGVPGGVGVAVLVIKYNKYGLRGWLVLSFGTIVRTFTWIGIYYLVQKYGPALGPFYDFFTWVFEQ